MKLKEIREEDARERKDTLKDKRDIAKEERDRTVEDKKSIGNLASQLEFPGFSEAGERIRDEVTSSGGAADISFEEQNQDATDNIFTPQKDHEEELYKRGEGLTEDLNRIEKENLSTDTAQNRLDQAKSFAGHGIAAVDKVKEEQGQEREDGEMERDEQKNRKDNIIIEFNK